MGGEKWEIFRESRRPKGMLRQVINVIYMRDQEFRIVLGLVERIVSHNLKVVGSNPIKGTRWVGIPLILS